MPLKHLSSCRLNERPLSIQARSTFQLMNPDGSTSPGMAIRYGQKVLIRVATDLDEGFVGFIDSLSPQVNSLGTQVVGKREVSVRRMQDGVAPSYSCTWEMQPASFEQRIPLQGHPVNVAAGAVFVHCRSAHHLAGTTQSIQSEFGVEAAVCVYTHRPLQKVNMLAREATGAPKSPFGTREELDENIWEVVCK